jgi:hypothetical protein
VAKKLDPRLLEILTTYGERPEDALWDCHGTWVAYHAAVERIAARAGIEYDAPQVLVADRDAAAILVSGKLKGRAEWTVGEAVINVNYRVSGKQAAYPFAMAEKRAKDRLTLKLIGLHGLVYSEEEADDFKPAKQQEIIETKYGEVDADWVPDGTMASSASLKRKDVMTDFSRELFECETLISLTAFKIAWRKKAKAEGFNHAFLATMKDQIERREAEIMAAMSPEALADVPLKDALKASVLNAG